MKESRKERMKEIMDENARSSSLKVRKKQEEGCADRIGLGEDK
jgi:hypothetical protein